MFDKIAVMQMANEMSSHAAQRQTIVAQNIANADTPGYRARDISPFATAHGSEIGVAMRATRPGHISTPANSTAMSRSHVVESEISPNGNSVSLEMEMVRSAEARSSHNRALAIYSSSLNILRTSLGRG